MGKRGAQPWSREALQPGTVSIRVRRRGRRIRRVRMIKLPNGRWVNYARWWWEEHRGPIPEGMRVAHLDGDGLNDDPDNLVLASPGDVAFLCHERDPAMSEANFAKLREATAEHNRLRARINRLDRWMPTRWYPVCRFEMKILNDPSRRPSHVYHRFGVRAKSGNSIGPLIADAVGYPSLNLAAALFMAATIELQCGDEWPLRHAVRDRVIVLRELLGLAPLREGTFHSVVWQLRRDGFLKITGRSRAARTIALLDPESPCPVFAVLGSRLSDPLFAGYEKVST